MKLALMAVHDALLTARVKQTMQANKRRRTCPLVVGDLVYISTKNISFPKGTSRKSVPKFVGPYKIIQDFGNYSFRIELPNSLRQRGIHDVFHSSLLCILSLMTIACSLVGQTNRSLSSEEPLASGR